MKRLSCLGRKGENTKAPALPASTTKQLSTQDSKEKYVHSITHQVY
jgi:hypothetical protein